MSHDTHAHATDQHDHGHGQPTDFSAMVELLDLDAEVFADLLTDSVALVRATAGDAVHRIADVGCGSGTGTLALGRAYPDAILTPVDVEAALLDHLLDAARSADEAGPTTEENAAGSAPIGARIRPVVADLDQPWPEQLHELDLIWASASVHHLADPPAALVGLLHSLVPGGWLALTEVDDVATFQPLFLPDGDRVGSGLEQRLRAAQVPELTAHMPYLGADWTPLLTDAGFEIVVDQVFDVTLSAPLPANTGRYALVFLTRLREQLTTSGTDADLPAEDLAALDALIADGPDNVLLRDDLAPRTRRRLWIARRP